MNRDYNTEPELIVAPIVVQVFHQLDQNMRDEIISTLQGLEEMVSGEVSDSINDFSVSVVGELVAIPFGSDGLDGDSVWDGGLDQPYTNQDFAELEANMVDVLQKKWEMDSKESAQLEWDESFDDLVGYWIVPKLILDMFDFPNVGNDSAVYAMTRTFKAYIQKNAIKTLIRG